MNEEEAKMKLARYAEIKRSLSELENELNGLKPEIMQYLSDQNVEKLPTSVGTFTVTPTTTWKYSPAVKKLQEEEKARGIATQDVTYSLRYTAPKAEI